MHIPYQAVIDLAVEPPMGLSSDYGRPIGAAVIMLKQSFIVCPGVILIVAVEALGIGNPHCKFVLYGISGQRFMNGPVQPPVMTVISVKDVTGCTPACPV